MDSSKFVENIVHEVKSQGFFDEFRKDCMSDVDTKPAYQNLRLRVESTVKKFLSDQTWTPESNKLQMREKLRKHITECGFLDAGVERIVDQVVNPKIGSVFQPKIELIAYKYLGITPPVRIMCPTPPRPHFIPPPPMPIMLSVETTPSLLPTDLEQISPDSDKGTVQSDYTEDDHPPGVDVNEKDLEDDISPPFEPIVKIEDDSKKCTENTFSNATLQTEKIVKQEHETELLDESTHTAQSDSIKEDVSRSQESQLSQVSSDSRLTAGSNESTVDAGDSKDNSLIQNAAVNISEEAQMPKFCENSCDTPGDQKTSELHFDILKDAIKFEGTERKNLTPSNGNVEDAIMNAIQQNIGDTNNPVQKNDETRLSPNAQESSFGSYLDDTQSSANQLCIDEKGSNEQKEQSKSVEDIKLEENPPSDNPTIKDTQTKQHESVEKNSSQTSSSSRHKKHSKEKRRHEDKHRGRSKERERSREKSHSHSKYSSSSGYKRTSSYKEKYSRHDKSSTIHSLSASSSRSSVANESLSTKRSSERRDIDKRYKSKDSKERAHHPGNSKKTDRRKDVPRDDHHEHKNKSHRRKSTDSNDDDRQPNNNGSRKLLDFSKLNSKNITNEEQGGSNNTQKPAADGGDGNKNVSKVVILNDILENPLIDFIELELGSTQIIKSSNSHITFPNVENEIKHSESCAKVCQKINTTDKILSPDKKEIDLLFFDENEIDFSARLGLLESVNSEYRSVINILRLEKESDRDKIVKRHLADSLHIDCIELDDVIDSLDDNVANNNIVDNPKTNSTSPKRYKHGSKTSPALSDASFNSKENHVLEKNTNVIAKSLNLRRASTSISKLCQQQRYTNADLYKPRPVLSQRSRRRRLNTLE